MSLTYPLFAANEVYPHCKMCGINFMVAKMSCFTVLIQESIACECVTVSIYSLEVIRVRLIRGIIHNSKSLL